MKSLGSDAGALPVTLEPDQRLTVEGEVIGRLDGFRFVVDPDAGVADRKMLLAAGEKALPGLLTQRAHWLLSEGLDELEIAEGAIRWQGRALAEITLPDDFSAARLTLAREVSLLPEAPRAGLEKGLAAWLEGKLEPLAPLRKLAAAARDPEAGSQARALLHTLIDARGVVSRENAGLEHLPKEMRPFLRKLGVTFGALDIFAGPLLKPAPRQLLHALGLDTRPLEPAMRPVLASAASLPAGYRPAGEQAIRVDLAEKILRAAFDTRMQMATVKAKPEPVVMEQVQTKSEAEPENKPKLDAQSSDTSAAEADEGEPVAVETPEAAPAELKAQAEPVPEAAPVPSAEAVAAQNGETEPERKSRTLTARPPKPSKPAKKAKPPKAGKGPKASKARPERNARFKLDLALAISVGLEEGNAQRLLGSAGFRLQRARKLGDGAFGPVAPDMWTWRPRHADDRPGQRRHTEKRGSDQRNGAKPGGKGRGQRQGEAGGQSRRSGKRGSDDQAADNRRAERPANGGNKGGGNKSGGNKGSGKPSGNRPPKRDTKPDTGPARSGGAFDALADLLRK